MKRRMLIKSVQPKIAAILGMSFLSILTSIQTYGDTEITLSQPYSIPNGVNGNEKHMITKLSKR